MTEQGPFDRRWFLRRAGLAALAAPVLPWSACVPEPADTPERRAGAARAAPGGDPVDVITRPVLLPWADDAVHLSAPPSELPVAYVSMAARRLFVDFDYRDQVYWDLHAHISVSTGVWRLPLVGDPPSLPVMPGDVLREFEELTMRDWDPTAEPAENDIRIMRGQAVTTRVDFACAPVAGGGAWVAAGPWEVERCGGLLDALCREEFFAVGSGVRYADRDCTQPLGPVRVLTWACREASPRENS